MADSIVASVADLMGEVGYRLAQLQAVVQVAQDPMGESLASMNPDMQLALVSLIEDRIIEMRRIVDSAAT